MNLKKIYSASSSSKFSHGVVLIEISIKFVIFHFIGSIKLGLIARLFTSCGQYGHVRLIWLSLHLIMPFVLESAMIPGHKLENEISGHFHHLISIFKISKF